MAIPLLLPWTCSCARSHQTMMSTSLYKTVCSLRLLLLHLLLPLLHPRLCTIAVKLRATCATSLKHLTVLGVTMFLERFLFTAVHGRRAATDCMGILLMDGKLSFFSVGNLFLSGKLIKLKNTACQKRSC